MLPLPALLEEDSFPFLLGGGGGGAMSFLEDFSGIECISGCNCGGPISSVTFCCGFTSSSLCNSGGCGSSRIAPFSPRNICLVLNLDIRGLFRPQGNNIMDLCKKSKNLKECSLAQLLSEHLQY